MACVGGGIDVNWLVLAAACCVRGLVSGGGRGGVVWGWRCWWWGGRGWVLCWLGSLERGGMDRLLPKNTIHYVEEFVSSCKYVPVAESCLQHAHA